MYAGHSRAKALKHAQENADWFGVDYVVFTDTSGNYRIERYDATLTCHREGTAVTPNHKIGEEHLQ